MIRLITAKRLRKLVNTIDGLTFDVKYERDKASRYIRDRADAIEARDRMYHRLHDHETGAEFSTVVRHVRQELKGAQAVANAAAAEAVRLQRHNQALRDALTALGGAVIELQDITQ
jgi:hypothetical protein